MKWGECVFWVGYSFNHLKTYLVHCNVWPDKSTFNFGRQECPKCHVTIEKDGGCNHMVCRNQNCKAEFCWVCLGPWEPHGSAWWVHFHLNWMFTSFTYPGDPLFCFACCQLHIYVCHCHQRVWIFFSSPTFPLLKSSSFTYFFTQITQ